MKRSTLSACAAFLAHATILEAQYQVRGVVFDSLASTVLKGAVIRLSAVSEAGSDMLTTHSDSSGRFRLDGVAAGRYFIGFSHPRLDSLGLDPVSSLIEVAGDRSGVEKNIALPGAASLHAMFCGGRTEEEGVLFGRALSAFDGAPISSGQVIAEWREIAPASGDATPQPVEVRSTLTRDGKYLLCGVPTDVSVSVHAVGDSTWHADGVAVSPGVGARSGTIEVRLLSTSPAQFAEFLLSPMRTNNSAARERDSATQRGQLSGRVLDGRNKGVPDARVMLRESGVADSVAYTDSTGRYTFSSVRGGTYAVEITKIGWGPVRSGANVRAQARNARNFRLDRRVTRLDRVNVFARISAEAEGFEKRRTSRKGFFLTADDIAKERKVAISFVLTQAPMLMQWGSNEFGRPVLTGPLRCTPALFVDGVFTPMAPFRDRPRDGNPHAEGADRYGDINNDIDNLVPLNHIGGIEVYAPAEAPARFGGGGATCSSIVIWTKGIVRD